MKKIYLDNAASTQMEPTVLETMYNIMSNECGNPSSIHAMGRVARTHVESARKTVADILNCSTGEIFFTSSATESNNMAIFCSVRDLEVQHIFVSPTEHPCILNSVAYIRKMFNVRVNELRVDTSGNVDPEYLEEQLKNSTDKALVAIMHGNNEIGTMINLLEIGNLCRKYGALFQSDTVQTLGKFNIDLVKTPLSFLSGSGHKIFGPKGIGIIYVNMDNSIQSFIKGGGQERNIRSGTENVYGIAGFAQALSWYNENRDIYHTKINKLRNHFKKILKNTLPDVQFFGNQEDLYIPNILSVSIPKTSKSELATFNLDIAGICASAGSACNSGSERGSHVMEAIKAPIDRKAIRFSFSPGNTIEELDYTTEILLDIVKN